ncbi:MAG: hemerythrin family protein [Magnetococcus sp. WYHC-3]
MSEDPICAQDMPRRFEMSMPDIDMQHAVLYSMLSCIKYRLETEADIEITLLIRSLRDFAMLHFEHEESGMVKECYPHWQRHMQEHRQFEAQIDIFESRFAAMARNHQSWREELIKVQDYLTSWFDNHIDQVDRALFRSPEYHRHQAPP